MHFTIDRNGLIGLMSGMVLGTAVLVVSLLVIAGNETTRHAISQIMLGLIAQPDQFKLLKEDPSLIESGLEELLRWATPVYHFRRTATKDVELGGKQIKEGDKVVVIAGKDKGREGEITRVLTEANKAVVSGVNVAIRHTRQTAQSQGGRIAKEMPIELSNLALVDGNGKATRVGFRMEGDKKVRFAKTTGEAI